ENLDDPNRYLGPNPSHLSHLHQFVEHPKLDVGYISNLATNLPSFYHFKDVDGAPRHMVINNSGHVRMGDADPRACMIHPVKIDKGREIWHIMDDLSPSPKPTKQSELSLDERMIVASNRQTKGHQNDYLTTFEVDSEGHLINPTTYDTNGQVIRGMEFKEDSTLLVFGHEAHGTIGMFGRNLETNKLT
ncbi:hypothetical protein F5888DRAFT_1690464, partial [Russula emetica]